MEGGEATDGQELTFDFLVYNPQYISTANSAHSSFRDKTSE